MAPPNESSVTNRKSTVVYQLSRLCKRLTSTVVYELSRLCKRLTYSTKKYKVVKFMLTNNFSNVINIVWGGPNNTVIFIALETI